jgi:hypothetical protein
MHARDGGSGRGETGQHGVDDDERNQREGRGLHGVGWNVLVNMKRKDKPSAGWLQGFERTT